jgi:two-component system, NtrC family, response regulator
MAKILIVDDDQIFSFPFVSYLKNQGHECDVAERLSEGISRAHSDDYDIVFLDVLLPDANGLDGINDLKKARSSPEIVVVTGKGDGSGAEMALKNGAWDYLEKPPAYNDIKLLISRAIRYRENKRQIKPLEIVSTDLIIGNDGSLRRCLEIAAKAAKSNGSVFITGETGTGKELVAKAVHTSSKRSKQNFVTLDCTNIPVNLVENLLFGHVKGVFTGADKTTDGLIKQADGGTLFLDEIADLSLSAQKSLLGTLQRKTFRALGAKDETPCDFRVISATNKDISQMIAEGMFRKDLYYRMVTFHIHLPPLRERPGDIPLLVEHYLPKICGEFGINTKTASNDFFETIIRYEWIGNVREMINVLHTTIANAVNEPVIYPHHLPLDIRIHLRKGSLKSTPDSDPIKRNQPPIEMIKDSVPPKLREIRDTAESKYLDELISLTDGDSDRMCHVADISRSGLYKLLGKHGKRLKR